MTEELLLDEIMLIQTAVQMASEPTGEDQELLLGMNRAAAEAAQSFALSHPKRNRVRSVGVLDSNTGEIMPLSNLDVQ